MKVLITGGSGMVGRNLLEHARANDFQLEAPGRRELDLSDKISVQSYFQKVKPDAVIHAAGLVGGIQANIAAPVRFLVENLQIGMNVILGAQNAGVEKLINIGSSCMYPREATNPLNEDDILTGGLEPTNEGYALAKISCSRLCNYVSSTHGVHYKTVIPCNLYGRHDKFDPQKSHMVPAVIRKISEAVENQADVVEVWGDGLARREFMFAGDLADFLLFAVEDIERLPQNLNVGIGVDHSVNDYYKAVADVLGYQGRFVHDMSKPAGMSQKLVNIQKLRNLGWQATTSLSEGIRKTYEFYKNGVYK
ncbi:GDP-L-fucose synthase [Rhizobium sp. Root483D2]|uniref:GDP-L-fucose synthase family protein n=1 Tax=Rhizobium sp. Root483D2 TaxID=1736545 RepID=UPI00071248F5|nr:GDP-L-fucose synthase [Rhizobium sp. Root483D2]KQY45725.1 GDP-fucose synthetase [Rhizobium sp. Root483D2]